LILHAFSHILSMIRSFLGSKIDVVMRFLMEPEKNGPPNVFLIEMIRKAFRFRPY
jgi:hypothetical protein